MATRLKNTGEGSGSCLICGDTKITENSEEPQPSTVLSESLQVYFILRHVLELSSEQLQSYLRSCPYPEKWVKICNDCEANYVDKCKGIFKELVEVKRRFQMARLEVVERIKKSAVQDEEEESGQMKRGNAAQLPFVLDIWKETRTFVQLNDYGPSSVDPYFFQAGDLMATEKAVEMMSKRERTAKMVNKCLPVGVDTIPNRKDDGDIKREPSSPFAHSGAYDYGTSSVDPYFSQTGDLMATEKAVEMMFEGDGSNNPADECPSDDNVPTFEDDDIIKTEPFSPSSTGRLGFNDLCEDYSGEGADSILDQSGDPEGSCSEYDPHEAEVSGSSSPDPSNESEESEFEEQPKKISSDSVVFHQKSRQKVKCPRCKKQMGDNRSLRHHLAAVHKLQEYLIYPCTFAGCKKAFHRKSLLSEHQLYHKPPQFACQVCGKGYATRALLKRHLKQCSLRGEKPFKCDQCPAAFARKDYLLNHVRKCHQNPKEGGGVFRARAQFKCSECWVVAGKRSVLQEHVDKMHAGKATITNYKGIKTENENNLEGQQDALFPCHYEGCHQTFSERTRLRRHTRVHERHKSFKCDLCPLQFSRKVTFENHKKLRHHPEGLESFKCSFCGKMLASKQSLEIHLYYKHQQQRSGKDDKNFACDLCPLTFVRESCLHIHKRVKHNPKPAAAAEKKEISCQCSECGQMYSNKRALSTHIKMAHERKLEVICDVCGATLRSPHYLKIHLLRKHNIGDGEVSKFPCTVKGCGRRFHSKSALGVHVSFYHEGQYKFECETCGKRVVSARNLRQHVEAMHAHRESKPWECDVCGKGFSTKEYLRLHKKTHLPKEGKVKVEGQRQ